MKKPNDEELAEQKIALARIILKARAPYFSHIFFGFVPVAVPGLDTMGVTKNLVLYYDPAWIRTIDSPEKIAGALFHECTHVPGQHCDRCTELELHKIPGSICSCDDCSENRKLAGIAADWTINQNNREAGWVLPDGKGTYPEDKGHPNGLILEKYYELLKKEKGKKGGQPAGKSGEKSDPGQQQDQGDGSTNTADSPKTPGIGTGGCGGIAGNPRPFEKELDEKYGRSEIEQLAIIKQTAQAVKDHIAQHGRGSVPGHIVESVEKSLDHRSKIRWQKELDVILKKCCGRIEAGGTDFSMARPSKRSHARQQLRPGLVSYQPEVCFIEDTSGSMGKKQILECTVQMVGILKSLGIESAWFIQADTTVAAPPRKIRVRDLLRTMEIHGRGGTDFDEALRAAEKLKPKPDIIIYLTDGDGSATYKPRGIEVVWCIVPGHYNRKPDASFGHVILITPEGTKKVA